MQKKINHWKILMIIRYLEKFKTTFVDKLKEISKKVGIGKKENFVMIVGKDCPQKDIWRMKLKDEYKGGRKSEEYISKFFKCAYDEDLFIKGGAHAIVSHPKLEADDCLALTCKELFKMKINMKSMDWHTYIL